jgi:hypothetical protein
MKTIMLVIAAAAVLAAQPKPAQPKPFQAQSSSTISLVVKDDEKTVETHNVDYQLTGDRVPGRPNEERLVLRKTRQEKQVVGDIGVEATTTLEAWPFGTDLKLKPLYALTVSGTDAEKVDDALWVASRGTEETEWWSVYQLGTGQHLFDTYVPLLKFSITLEIQQERYVGLEVPPDDVPGGTLDKRLKEPRVVAVLTYASEDKVVREALLTFDDPKQAQFLRSYDEETRVVALVEGPRPTAKGAEPSRKIKISFSQNWPSPPLVMEAVIPILGDDLDLAHAQLPPKMHIASFRR